jgi:8-oxo-dGTP pyrophosphatase MutT (NUDIX family)
MANVVRVLGNGWTGFGDPRDLPSHPAQDNLNRLPEKRLTVGSLRARFADGQRPWQPEDIPDRRIALAEHSPRPAAVLIPLLQPAGTEVPTVLLTVRPSHLRTHSGQIAFPGGGVDGSDADRTATAMREANEEVGLSASDIEVVGQMPAYITGTGFEVTPVIGLVHGQPELRCDPGEVEAVFEVPLPWLMDPSNHERRHITAAGEERSFYSMPWCPPPGEVEYFIWGVTAAILRNFYHYLRA